MALIVQQHVVADMYPVGSTNITAGSPVRLDTDGTVIPSDSTNLDTIIGIAGDSFLASEAQTTAYSASVVIGATAPGETASTRFTSNRVSDFWNETLASGKMTVYNSGGRFWISEDLVTSFATVTPGTLLEANTDGTFIAGSAGDGQVIAIAVGDASKYPSGVPGVDTSDGSIAISAGGTDGTNYWVPIILKV